MTKTRAERAASLDAWADTVDPAELRSADTDALRHIAELAQQRDDVDAELVQTVQAARDARCSWSEIGAMLGVSKQAAQRKYPGHRDVNRVVRAVAWMVLPTCWFGVPFVLGGLGDVVAGATVLPTVLWAAITGSAILVLARVR